MSTFASPKQNKLLAELPEEDYARLLPQLELVDLPSGQMLCKPDVELTHAYFPVDSIVSQLLMMENGASMGIAMIGCDGLIGTSLLMGGSRMPISKVVVIAGQAYRLNLHSFQHEFHNQPTVQYLLLRYCQALIAQTAQMAVCTRHHSLEQRLACWLLSCLDRLSGNQLIMTHELIGNMLGVRREGISTAAGHLQNNGSIKYRRGRMMITDRAALESTACECYSMVKREYERLLSPIRQPHQIIFRAVASGNPSQANPDSLQ